MAEKVLHVRNVNDYARYIQAPVLHELVSVIHYDELEHCRHSLNNYDVYGIFIGDERLESLTYGQVTYDLSRHALMCVSPGEIGGKTDTGEEIQTSGWALLFDPQLLIGTELGQRISSYTYFSYNTSEALLMTEDERNNVVALMELIRKELLTKADDDHTERIVVSLLSALLELISRYYSRQLSTPTKETASLLQRFENLLQRYYAEGRQRQLGLPTVKYCAQELFLSPNYFGDLISQTTGQTASQTIRRFVMQRARELILSGATVAETAEQLGFDYPQHFTRQFKQFFGQSPSAFRK